jgi:hypothetical protein
MTHVVTKWRSGRSALVEAHQKGVVVIYICTAERRP